MGDGRHLRSGFTAGNPVGLRTGTHAQQERNLKAAGRPGGDSGRRCRSHRRRLYGRPRGLLWHSEDRRPEPFVVPCRRRWRRRTWRRQRPDTAFIPIRVAGVLGRQRCLPRIGGRARGRAACERGLAGGGNDMLCQWLQSIGWSCERRSLDGSNRPVRRWGRDVIWEWNGSWRGRPISVTPPYHVTPNAHASPAPPLPSCTGGSHPTRRWWRRGESGPAAAWASAAGGGG